MLAGSTFLPVAGMGKAVDPTVLVADDQALLVVHAHRNPRALFFHGHGIEQIDLEAVGKVDPGG